MSEVCTLCFKKFITSSVMGFSGGNFDNRLHDVTNMIEKLVYSLKGTNETIFTKFSNQRKDF